MTCRLPLYLSTALAGAALLATSCNDDTGYENDPGTTSEYDNCAISAFSLNRDDSVLNALDSVFFSIDLVGARIFNADSLPKGTDVSRLTVSISVPSAKSVEVTYKVRGTERDTTVSLTETPGDSINFASGPVALTVTSWNGQATRRYEVKVNVHNVQPDTLYWQSIERIPFPFSPVSMKALSSSYRYQYYVLMAGADGTSYMARTWDPASNDWEVYPTPLPAGADINSFNESTHHLNILAGGVLYQSYDGHEWESTGVRMDHIYGNYDERVLGARLESGAWTSVTHPVASASVALPAGAPVSGTSQLVTYSTNWSAQPMVVTMGGKDAGGTPAADCWAYDGTSWQCLGHTSIAPRSGMTLISYETPVYSADSWRPTVMPALLAMGGELSDGSRSKEVYVSYDYGLSWKAADSYLQFPSAFPAFSGATAAVVYTRLSSRSTQAMGWQSLPVAGAPCWASPVVPASHSRISQPAEYWWCDYIYLIGGTDGGGRLINDISRGAINLFTFKPIL